MGISVTFSGLTLLACHQKLHPACVNLPRQLPKFSGWELAQLMVVMKNSAG